jgi:hypothetical protein
MSFAVLESLIPLLAVAYGVVCGGVVALVAARRALRAMRSWRGGRVPRVDAIGLSAGGVG